MILGTKRRVFCLIALIMVISMSLMGCSNNQTDTSTTSSSVVLTSNTETSLTSATTTLASPTPIITSTSTSTTTTTPSQLEIKEIVDSATGAWAKLVSYQYDMNMLMNMSGTVESKAQNVNITLTGTGMTNVTTGEMQMTANMDIESPGQGKITMPMVAYLINGWQYTKVSIPMSGEQWIKMKMDMSSYEAKDDSQHMLDLLKTASGLTFEGLEDIEGTPCYVLSVNPDQALMAEMFKSLLATTQTAKTDLDLNKSLKKFAIREWISKGSTLLKKCDLTASLVLTGSDLGSSQVSDSMNVDMTMTITMDQYNKMFTITLPPESQNAKEIPTQK
jgi:hypothetical protein